MRARFLPFVLLLLAAAGVAVVAGGWWPLDGKPRTEPAATERQKADPGRATTEHDDPGRKETTARTALTGDTEGPPPADPDLHLQGVVVSPSGEPYAGATVRLFRSPAAEYSILDRDYARERHRVGETRTGPRGRFALRLPPGRPHLLEVEAEGHPVRKIGGCYAGEHVRVRLVPGAVLHGRVLHAADRTPVADARVHGWRRAKGALRGTGQLFEGRTGDDGRFRFENLEPGPLGLDVVPREAASPRAVDLELPPGGERGIEILVEPGTTIRGIVRDASTGAPIPGARVREGWRGGRVVTTDAHGRFAMKGFSHIRIQVSAPDYATVERLLRDPRSPQELTTRVEIELHRGRRARGIVLDPDGTPLEDVYVAATASVHRDGTQRIDWVAGRTGPEGTFELEHLRPDLRHTLLLRKEGFGTLLYAFPETEPELPVVDFGVLRMPRPALLAGVLVDENGEPIPHQAITLRGANADRFGNRQVDPFRYRSIDGYVAERDGRTDGDGRFSFADLAAGTYRLRVDLAGHGRHQTLDVALAEGEHRTGLHFEVRRGLSIGGTVRTADAASLPTVYVSVDPEETGVRTSADVEVVDGRFRAEGLAPGTYSLSIYPYSGTLQEQEGREYANQVIPGVPAGRQDVEIVLRRQDSIEGIVLDAAGEPVADLRVATLDAAGGIRHGARSDEDGRFVLEVPADTAFTVAARRRREEGEEEAPPWAVRVEGVQAGTSGLTLHWPGTRRR